MVTHDLDSLYSISDRVAVVADQKIVEVSPIAELERSDHPWIRAFLGGRAERAEMGWVQGTQDWTLGGEAPSSDGDSNARHDPVAMIDRKSTRLNSSH